MPNFILKAREIENRLLNDILSYRKYNNFNPPNTIELTIEDELSLCDNTSMFQGLYDPLNRAFCGIPIETVNR